MGQWRWGGPGHGWQIAGGKKRGQRIPRREVAPFGFAPRLRVVAQFANNVSSRAEFRAGAGGTERSREPSPRDAGGLGGKRQTPAVRTSAARQRTAEVPRLRCAHLSTCAALGMTRCLQIEPLPLVVPRSVIRPAIGVPAGEDGVDFVEALGINRRNLRRWFRLDHDAAALGKINRLSGPKDPVLVDGVDGFHAARGNTNRCSPQSASRCRWRGRNRAGLSLRRWPIVSAHEDFRFYLLAGRRGVAGLS